MEVRLTATSKPVDGMPNVLQFEWRLYVGGILKEMFTEYCAYQPQPAKSRKQRDRDELAEFHRFHRNVEATVKAAAPKPKETERQYLKRVSKALKARRAATDLAGRNSRY